MVRAVALRAVPIVQSLEPSTRRRRLAALSLPANPSPAAYVCVGTTCSAPVTDPDSLIETVRRMAKDQQVAQGD